MPLRRARLIPLDASHVDRIHRTAARSVFWELDPLVPTRAVFAGTESEVDKAAWLFARAYEQQEVGFSIIDPVSSAGALATLLMCPPSAAPGAVRMPTAPFSPDAFCLTSLHIDKAVAGTGWEAVLIDAAVAALTQQSLPAVEAFGHRAGSCPDLDSSVISGANSSLNRELITNRSAIGLMPVDVLESAGFTVVAQHPVIPRLRLELPPAHDLLTEREISELLAGVAAGGG